MEQQPRLPLWFLACNCAVIGSAFAIGLWLGAKNRLQLPEPQHLALGLIHAEILESHVESQHGGDLLDRAISAMVESLDDYSRYVPKANVEQYEESSMGRYEGVGMVMTQAGEDIVIQFPFAGGPAERAGILPGDRILAVDGQRLDAIDIATRFTRSRELVRGPADSSVELLLGRDDSELALSVERSAVQRPVVKWVHFADRERGLGYLYLSDFHRGIAEQVDAAIAELLQEGQLHGLVVDLRFNGGGSLDECIALCRQLQPDGVIVSTRRRGEELERVEAEPSQCRQPDLPLVLLVNEDSASASEVLAGCLQDHDRATIVGARTYGKGVVNTVYSWPDFKLKLTTAHFYTPLGRSLGGSHRPRDGEPLAADAPGIKPDIEATATAEERGAAFRRLMQLEVPRAYREAVTGLTATYENITVPQPPDAAEDPQLAKALAVLADKIDTDNGK